MIRFLLMSDLHLEHGGPPVFPDVSAGLIDAVQLEHVRLLPNCFTR